MNVLGGLMTTTKKVWPARLMRAGVLSPRLVLLGLIGVVLLAAGSLYDASPAQPARPSVPAEPARSAAAPRSYEEALEAKLANLLSQVKGAGAVAVSITFEGGGTQEYARNTVRESRTIQERDTAGGTRTTTENKESDQVLLSRDNGSDRPVMVRETRPAVKGVLVIAEGAADSTVKASLTRAVEAGLGIPPYKITVLPQRK
jgi:stage III sporulation protein AG